MREVYAYRARTGTGQLERGTVEATNQREALDRLHQLGLTVVGFRLQRGLTRLAGVPRPLALRSRVTVKDLAVSLRQLSVLYGAGIPVLQCVHTVQEQCQQARLKGMWARCAMHIQSGQGLGEAMTHYPEVFPPILYHMVTMAEMSGALDIVLNHAANHFEREHAIEQKVRSALAYPKVVLAAIGVVGLFVVAYVLPQFTAMFTAQGVELPVLTQMVLGSGEFLLRWGWLILAAIACSVMLALSHRRTPQGRLWWDRMALRYPAFGDLNRKKLVSRFCSSLAVLARSGVQIVPAMTLTRTTVGNLVVGSALQAAQEAVTRGQTLGPELAKTGYFPPMVTQMVIVGEETGTLDDMLEKAAAFIDAEILNLTNRITQLIEPMVIVALAAAVALVMVAVVLPMFATFGLIR
jgi:type IV pilus assembly protein PilC